MTDKQQALKEIGLCVRRLRDDRKLSLLELSDLVDMERSNIVRIEKGRTNFTIGTLVRIANALNVPLQELLP